MSRRTQIAVIRSHEPDRLSQVWLETAYEQLVPQHIRVVRQKLGSPTAETCEPEGGQWDEHQESGIVRTGIKRTAG